MTLPAEKTYKRLLRSFAIPQQTARSALIIPPATPGSLGDAAMISATVQTLREGGGTKMGLTYGKRWVLDAFVDSRIASERYFYKRSSLQGAWLEFQVLRYAECYFIGADVIDGAYNPASVCARLGILEKAASTGRKATILGASYNESSEATTRQALQALPSSVTICARDPGSKRRLETALNRSIRQTADLAFLLTSRPDHPLATKAIAWIHARRKSGDQVVALNANNLHAEQYRGIRTHLPILLDALTRKGLSVILVPHDTRTAFSDVDLLKEGMSGLSPDQKARTYFLHPESPGAVKATLSEVDLLVTGRMHAAILALSTGVPTMGFAYQSKFEGLYSLLGIEDAELLMPPHSLAEDPDAVISRTLRGLGELGPIRTRIEEHLPAVMNLSRRNFD